MAGAKEEASRNSLRGEQCAEVWAVEVLESAGTKGNTDTLAVAVADMAQEVAKPVSIKLFNITTTVPCGLGSAMQVSQVENKTIKSHELHVFKNLVAPVLATPVGKKAKAKYIPVRNNSREEGLRELAHKIRANRLYIPVKKNSSLVEKLALEVPGGCTVVGVCGGKAVSTVTAANVDMFDSQEQGGAQANSGIEMYEDVATEFSAGSLGTSGRMDHSMSLRFQALHLGSTFSGESQRSSIVDGDSSGILGIFDGQMDSLEFPIGEVSTQHSGEYSSSHVVARASSLGQQTDESMPAGLPIRIARTSTMPGQAGEGGLPPYSNPSANFSIQWNESPGSSRRGNLMDSQVGQRIAEQSSLSAQFSLPRAMTFGEQAHFSGPMATFSPSLLSGGGNQSLEASLSGSIPESPASSASNASEKGVVTPKRTRSDALEKKKGSSTKESSLSPFLGLGRLLTNSGSSSFKERAPSKDSVAKGKSLPKAGLGGKERLEEKQKSKGKVKGSQRAHSEGRMLLDKD